MTYASLHQLEREVETARAKLASDLSALRSPAASAQFTATLKQEATSGLQSTVHSLVEDIKGRAAANPAAVLAICAGIAWRLVRHPPIATALIGAGLLSLFRTSPARTNGRAPADYFSHAKTRLQEQAGKVADMATEQAAALGGSVTQKTSELAATAKERVQEWTAEAKSFATQTASDLAQRTAAMSSRVSGAVGDAAESARSNSASAASDFAAATSDWSRQAHETVNDLENKDKLLLGTAAIAVAAAIGIALQRRASHTEARTS
jgi:hypothetical protein